MTERLAVIDLGSNSVRLIVMHIYHNGAYNLVYHQKEAVRLSEGMNLDGALQIAAMERAFTALDHFSHMIRLFQVDHTLAVATAAVRNASNGDEFIRRAEAEYGIRFEVISGVAEARLGFLGVINTLDVQDAILFDLGGGSTELTLIRKRKAKQSISIPIGAVNLADRFCRQEKNRLSATKLSELIYSVNQEFKKIPWLKKTGLPLIGVGGTVRNLAKMDQRRKNYPFSRVHNYRFGALSFQDLWQDLSGTTLAQRRKYPGLSSERADIIIPGLAVIKCLLDTVNSEQLIVSGCGVREGLFLQYYLASRQLPEVIDNIIDHSSRNMLRFYKGDPNHAEHVAHSSALLFDALQPLHQLPQRSKILLQVAALLHDIGITINYYDHARHSAYLVENARLFGLTHREQMLTAVIAGWHQGAGTKYIRHRLYHEFLDDSDWQGARKLAAILAIAESLDTTQMQLVQQIRPLLTSETLTLGIKTSEPAPIEIEAVQRLTRWFRREYGISLDILKVK